MTTIRPAANQAVWDHERRYGNPNPFRGFGRAAGETRNNPDTGTQEHLIAWQGEAEPTWTDWRHVHDSPADPVTGTRWCPTCRKRRDVEDQFDDSEYTGGDHETHFTVYVMDCGHSTNYGNTVTHTAP